MKSEYREMVSFTRQSLDRTTAAAKSRAIQKRLLLSSEYKKAKTVLLYVSIRDEVDTRDLITNALKSKRVVVPVVNGSELVLSEIKNLDGLVEGSYHVPEPKKDEIKRVNPKDIDLAVVPGMVFDTTGNRIGYGKGYYDRLLKDIRSKKVGLAFRFQVLEEFECEAHDVKVDMIITDEGIITCKDD